MKFTIFKASARATTTFFFLTILLGVVLLQWRYDVIIAEPVDPPAPIHRSVMPATVVHHLAFGFNNILADYYWVSSVQAYLRWDSLDTYYPEYFRIINALDPRFEYPYTFAIFTVPTKKNPASLNWLAEITEEGIRAFPKSYQIPFSAAVEYHIIAKDNARAIHYLEIADSIPNAPEIVKRSHAIYLMRDATDYKKSRTLFETILATTDNDETKAIISERIELLDFIENTEQEIMKFKNTYGAYPISIDEMVQKNGLHLAKRASVLVAKYAPQIDQNNGKIILR